MKKLIADSILNNPEKISKNTLGLVLNKIADIQIWQDALTATIFLAMILWVTFKDKK